MPVLTQSRHWRRSTLRYEIYDTLHYFFVTLFPLPSVSGSTPTRRRGTTTTREKNLLIPAAAGSFSLDASLGLLATRRRLGRRGNLFRHVLSFCGVSCMYEEFQKKKKTSNLCARHGTAHWGCPVQKCTSRTHCLLWSRRGATRCEAGLHEAR